MTNKSKLVGIAGLTCLMLLLLRHCYNAGKTEQITAIPVEAVIVELKNIPDTLELSGTAQAIQTVSVKPQVTGQIMKINFQEGQTVKAGDLLFEIDSRGFQDQLSQAQANLLRDQAQLDNAEKEEKRYRNLLKKGVVTDEQYTQILSSRDALRGTVANDSAAVEEAKLQIEYSKITSPIDGKTGEVLFTVGNIAAANTTPLVSINQISPIYVNFSVAEKYLNPIQKAKDSDNLTVSVSADGKIQDGQVTFIDNTIDKNTGTVKIKASFPNKDESLWPGRFVKVLLNIHDKKDFPVIPVKAVQVNQQGQYVFVADKDNKAEIRHITVRFSNNLIAVVESGLSAGEKVITGGQIKLSEGSPVAVTITGEKN